MFHFALVNCLISHLLQIWDSLTQKLWSIETIWLIQMESWISHDRSFYSIVNISRSKYLFILKLINFFNWFHLQSMTTHPIRKTLQFSRQLFAKRSQIVIEWKSTLRSFVCFIFYLSRLRSCCGRINLPSLSIKWRYSQ